MSTYFACQVSARAGHQGHETCNINQFNDRSLKWYCFCYIKV